MGVHIYNGSNYNMLVFEPFLKLFAPYSCLICGQEGALVCKGCLPDLGLPLPSRCYRCQAASQEFAVCERCGPQSKLRHVWIYTEYTGQAKELVRVLKYHFARDAAKIIAECMIETLPHFKPEDVLLVPVPTATSRRRARGFDQAQLLAKHIARATGWQYMDALGRRGQSQQVGNKRNQRLRQLHSSFYRRASMPAGKHIILVDDVVTTGATIETAARVMRSAGASTVDAVLFAQAN